MHDTATMPIDAELAALHQPLLRFAQVQLRNDSMAEVASSSNACKPVWRSCHPAPGARS